MSLDVAVIIPWTGFAAPFVLRAKTARTAVQGPSGAGKTTLLRVIAGLEPRARGFVRFDGEVWQDDSSGVNRPAHERRVGWVPQESLLFPHLCVRRNLAFSPHAREADVTEIASRFGLVPLLERSPRRLSGGERQRVALGRALAARPKLLLLDEAFSATHRELRATLLAELDVYCREKGISVVMVTHQGDDVAALACERIEIGETGVPDRGGIAHATITDLSLATGATPKKNARDDFSPQAF